VETSSIHLDILRDLKRIYSHICAVAYPVLEVHGDLRETRFTVQRQAHDIPGSMGGRTFTTLGQS
jgi:phosphate:Na+ symporter